MYKKSNFVIVLSMFALVFSTLACGASASSQPAEDEPAQSFPAAEPPVSAPEEKGTDPNAIVACAQIVPPDELKNLLINFTPSLAETSSAGSTSCVWSFTNATGQPSNFSLQADFSTDAVSLWESTRQSELANEPSDIVVVSINGLGDENYTWVSQSTGQRMVYVRKGNKTLIMRFVPQEVYYMYTESGIIDMADRFFNRF